MIQTINEILKIQDPLSTSGIELLVISRNSDIRWDRQMTRLDELVLKNHEEIARQRLLVNHYQQNPSAEHDHAISMLNIAIHQSMLRLSDEFFDTTLAHFRKTHGYALSAMPVIN
jgi:hypothetical protein